MSSQKLHEIQPLSLDDTFLNLYIRVNDSIQVLNAIRIYDVQGTGGIIHKRAIDATTREVLQLNLAATGPANQYGYGIGMIDLQNPASYPGGVWEGGTYAVRLKLDSLQDSALFLTSGSTVYVDDYDYVCVAATGSRGDGAYRPLKVFAKDSLPYTIGGDHRFSGKVFFDGSEVVLNSSQLHIDDNLLFIASAGSTDNPSYMAGLSNNVTLAGGSGSGFVIKGSSGDKYIVYHSSDSNSPSQYYSFLVSENIETNKGFVSPTGIFKFVGVSASAPYIALRTSGQDSSTLPLGWKIYQSVTGDSVGTLKIKREGITDFDALELFPNSEVKIGTIASGTGGNGSFKTKAAKFSVPATREHEVLDYSWQNRDIVELKGTTDGGMFAEPTSRFLPGTVLTFNDLGKYTRARWDSNPSTGYKESEVVGIIEKITSDDYLLSVPVTGVSGGTYSTSSLAVNENVSIVGNGITVRGYVYDNLPAVGLSGIKVFVDSFPEGITAGSFAPSGTILGGGGATLYGSSGVSAALRISSSIGITVSTVDFAVIVRQGVFQLPESGVSGATGYDIASGLTAGYLFYLGGTANGTHTSCYGGVTYSPNNLFDPELFYQSGANVAKPLFIYLGQTGGKRLGLFQHYQGLGITYSITSFDLQPIYYDNETQEVQQASFELFGEIGGRNKVLNSGFDFWSRLDVAGSTYSGFDGGLSKGVTFGESIRSEYPFGTTYSGSPSPDPSNILVSGYIADGYFLDTLNRSRTLHVSRQQIGVTLPQMITPPIHELKITQVTGGFTAGKARLYSLIKDHRTLSDHDMNFSFYARKDSGGTFGFTAGVAFVWASGATYAKIENKGAFLSDGVAVTGGTFDLFFDTVDSSYGRHQFSFSSETLAYSGATGNDDSFLAPFIEIGNLGPGESVYLTAFQITKGISPKPYEKRPFGVEKSECDRFFQNIVIANGGYYPIFTGASGPSIFSVSNLQIPFVQIPSVVSAIDIEINGIVGASAAIDPLNVKKNSISIFRDTSGGTSPTYHRYFESVYSLDASGFSGTVATRLVGMA